MTVRSSSKAKTKATRKKKKTTAAPPRRSSSKAYHCPVHARIKPLLPKPPLTLLSLCVGLSYDLFTFFVAFNGNAVSQPPAVTPTTSPFVVTEAINKPSSQDKPMSYLQAASQQRAATWTAILPKKMKQLKTDRSGLNVANFIQRKIQSLKRSGTCFRCLRKGHISANCSSKQNCIGCGRSGHFLSTCPLLATEQSNATAQTPTAPTAQSASLNNPSPSSIALPSPPEPPPLKNPSSPSAMAHPLNAHTTQQQPQHNYIPSENRAAWAALNPIHNLHEVPIPANWEHADLPAADEFYEHRFDEDLIFLSPCNPAFFSHGGTLPRSIAISFTRAHPLRA